MAELTEETKWVIDNMNYEEMLRLWRFAPSGHPYFQDGPAFDYFKKVMQEKKNATPDGGVAASKNVGWEQ